MTRRRLAVALVALALPLLSAATAAAQCTPPAQLGVVFVIDDSGSMASSDGGKHRGAGVAAGLRELGPGRVAAAVAFASDARAIFGPTVLDANNTPTLGQQVQSSLRSSGGTDFEAAFAEAKRQLDAMPTSVDRKAVVFLTDGQASDPASDDAIVAAGIPIHTVGFDDAGPSLAAYAQRSGGISQEVETASEVQGAIARVVAASTCQRVDGGQTFDLPPGGVRDVEFTVPQGTPSFNALVAWGAGNLQVRLIRPDRSVLGPGATRAGETFEEHPSQARATAQNPAAGRWKIRLTAVGGNAQTIRVTVDLFGGGVADRPLTARPQPAGPGCETEVALVGRVAWSKCLRASREGWKTGFPLRVAGLDIEPRAGDITIHRDGRLTAGNARLFVTTSGPLLPGGELTLSEGTLDLDLRTQLVLPFQIAGESRPKVGGLPVERTAGFELGWTTSGARIKLALSLGRDFLTLLPPGGAVDRPPGSGRGTQSLRSGFGLEAELTTSNERGLAVDRLSGQLDAGRVFGALAVQSLRLSYEAQYNLWTGSATIVPFSGPLARHALPTLTAGLGVTVNPLGFGAISVEVSDINKPIGPWIFLQKLGGSVTKVPPPFTVAGSAGITIGPSLDIPVLGTLRAVEIDGTASYSHPATFKTTSGVKLLRQPVGSSEVEVNLATAEGSFKGDVHLEIADTGLSGRAEGWLKGGDFQVYGNMGLKILGQTVGGGEGFVNSRGMGGCHEWWGPDYGFRWEFARGAGGVDPMRGCDFGGLVFPAQPAQAGGARGFTVRRGTRGMLVRIRGAGGVPAVAVVGPSRRFEIPAAVPFTENQQFAALRDGRTNDLYVVLNAPAPGAWRVEPLAGSAPLAPLGLSRALPEPRLRTTLRRTRGGRYVLRYRMRRVRGQQLRLVERGPGGISRRLIRTRRSRGTVRFRPATGAAGGRAIEATVLQDGTPRDVVQAGRFRVRRTVRPARPGRVRVRRQRGGVVTISWRRVRGARGYVVAGRLRDGRRVEVTLRSNRVSHRLFGVSRRTSGRFWVRSVSASGTQSARRIGSLRRARS